MSAECGFCHGKPVGDAAEWADGVPRPPAACPRCGETNEETLAQLRRRAAALSRQYNNALYRARSGGYAGMAAQGRVRRLSREHAEVVARIAEREARP